MTTATNFGRFVWYDLMSTDPEASKRFYTGALGWGTRVDRPLMGIEGRPPYTSAGAYPPAALRAQLSAGRSNAYERTRRPQ